MEKIFFYMIILFLPVSVISSCSESEKLMFDQPASIYLYNAQGGGDFSSFSYTDSIQYTFLGKPAEFTESKTGIWMMATGYKSGKARRINLVADPASTLQAGVDYVLPAEILLPADTLAVAIPIAFKRTAKLKQGLYWVRFFIEDSEDLAKGYTAYLSFKYIITEKPVKPINWPSSYYGDYSAAKLRFMYSVLGSDINWSAYPPVHMANSGALRTALAKYEREYGPLMGLAEDKEENIRVEFPG